MRETSYKHAPLRHGDAYLARLFSALILAVFVIIFSLFDINTPQSSRLASEVGFSLLFLLPMAAIFYWMFIVARTEEATWLEERIEGKKIRVFFVSFIVLVALVILDEFSELSRIEVSLSLASAILTFITSLLFVLSFPFERSFILFLASTVFVIFAIMPYNNVIAGILRGQSLLWVLSFLPFIATAPAGFEKIVHLMRARYQARRQIHS